MATLEQARLQFMRIVSAEPEPDAEVLTREIWAGLSEAERMDLTRRFTEALTSERPWEVRALQRQLGVAVDGIAGEETRAAYAALVGLKVLHEVPSAEPEKHAEGMAPALSGLTVVVTGKLSVKRVVFEAWLKEQGATVEPRITSGTDYLVTGDDQGRGPSSKLQKARKFGVRTITERDIRAKAAS